MVYAMLYLDNYLLFQVISLLKMFSRIMKSFHAPNRSGCEAHYRRDTCKEGAFFNCDALGFEFSVDEATSQCIQKRTQRLCVCESCQEAEGGVLF